MPASSTGSSDISRIGAAYDRLSADLQNTTRGGFEFDLAYNLAYFYGTLYFF